MERDVLEEGMKGKQHHELNHHEVAHLGAMAYEAATKAQAAYADDPSASNATALLVATAELAIANHIRATR